MILLIIGLMTGGIFGILLMCLLQIHRDNEAQRRIDKAIEFNQIVSNSDYVYSQDIVANRNLRILGGGVDDE